MRALVAIVVVASVGVADAAPRTIRGVVMPVGSKKPIAGATVLTEHGELAVTDLDGYFTIAVNRRPIAS